MYWPVIIPVWIAVAATSLLFPRPRTKSRGQPWPQTQLKKPAKGQYDDNNKLKKREDNQHG